MFKKKKKKKHTEHRVLGRSGAIEEIQELVVDSVDEELGSTRVRSTGVGLNDNIRSNI